MGCNTNNTSRLVDVGEKNLGHLYEDFAKPKAVPLPGNDTDFPG